MGAAKVTGIDISKKMLEIAQNENSDTNIEYKPMCGKCYIKTKNKEK